MRNELTLRRRLLTALVAGALLPAALVGCGIPDRTEVQVDGRGPAGEPGTLNGSGSQPPTRSATEDPKQFITEYLDAAAGEREQAYDRVKKFIAKEAQGRLPKKKQSSEVELTVVRLLESPEARLLTNEGNWEVTVRVQQVGVLRADGTLDKPTAPETEYEFKLRRADPGSQGLVITNLPNVLLLSVTALRQYYGTHTIYFWNSDQSQLVPDWRYLPNAVPVERRVTEVVRWLAGGPSEWLAPGVTRVPDGTAPINNATGSDQRWEVNLTMPVADDDRLAKFATQLAWSLPDLEGQLDLKIQNQKRRTIDLEQERAVHPLYPNLRVPERYCVYDGAIHPLAIGSEPVGTVPVDADANRNVVSAALSRAGDEVLAALVVTRSDQKQRLMVGTGPGPVTEFHSSAHVYRSIGRPIWLRSSDRQHPSGLVVADGTLYRFDGAAGMSPLAGMSRAVTAVAASLDGHRIALIMGGALYVAPVSVDGGETNVGTPRPLTTRLTKLTAVDWYADNQLVFAGNDGRQPAIYQTSVDGAVETPLIRDTSAPVSHLAAYPGGPSGPLPSFSYMYQATVAYRNNPVGTKIERSQVRDVADGAKQSDPSVPFFFY
ncbi:Sporulation and spore germination [Micromonospora chaiyaphumensis]|uniref:Sporulation and spore germination n=1 Tax=Micromonospora chaiyaphumensis TaxID=307119 RepID=A0A1C4V5H4_9ACTN|nr:Sporulation and spore germination [Micromonospora chaiyaphumensis]